MYLFFQKPYHNGNEKNIDRIFSPYHNYITIWKIFDCVYGLKIFKILHFFYIQSKTFWKIPLNKERKFYINNLTNIANNIYKK